MADRGDNKPPRGGRKGKPSLEVVGGTDGSREDAETGSPGRSGSARRPGEEEGPKERVSRALKGAKPVPKADSAGAGDGSQAGKRSGSARSAPPKLNKKDRKTAEHCAGLDQNDRDNARRLDAWYGENLAFVPGMGWIVWAGTHWEIDVGELAAAQLAQDLVDKIKLEPQVMALSAAETRLVGEADTIIETVPEADARDAFQKAAVLNAAALRKKLAERRAGRWKFAVSSGNRTRTRAMLGQAESVKRIDPALLDADPMALNVSNGTLRFSRRLEEDPENPDPDGTRMIATAGIEFTGHRKADMMTRVCEAGYDPKAACRGWEAFLARVQPDPAMRRFLQVFHAYALMIAGNDEQRIAYHYGTGANGKTVFLETLGRLAGGYRATVAPETIAGESQRSGSGPTPEIARLVNTRMVTIEELQRGIQLKEAFLKAISGGTRLVARFNYRDPFEFDPVFTAVLSGNDKPQIGGTDEGIWRRLLLVPWRVTIPEPERRPFGEVMDGLAAERPGILNWLIEGLRLYLADGLLPHVPPEVTAFTDDYRQERNPIGEFAANCLIRSEGDKVQAADAYEAYRGWSEANSMTPRSNVAFAIELDKLGFTKARGRVRYYQDVILAPDIPTKFDPRDGPPRAKKTDAGELEF